MKRHAAFILIGIFFFTLFSFAQMKVKDLPEKHRKWLEEEVVYIISKTEREVFLLLKTDRDRDLFIDAFWKQRDPTQGTPENEFKREHYHRIGYVNQYFGRTTPKPGWRTDRGRVYIILGPPIDTQRYDSKSEIYPTEVWFYQGLTDLGLPAGFNVVFFRRYGSGDYELYSPIIDGPQALLTTYMGDNSDYMAAYEELKEIDPMLASTSLSLVPGDTMGGIGRPSMSSDILLQNIERAAVRNIKDRYAKMFLNFKDIVETEYSTNYIESTSSVNIVKDPSGYYFVHYAIEPASLSVNQYENKYYTSLRLNGTVSDSQDKMVHQFEKKISLEFNEEQLKSISHRQVSIRDLFPLIPGRYKVSILLMNEVSKEFTSLERTLYIPSDEDGLQMTSILLGFNEKAEPVSANRIKPFKIDAHQIYFHANRIFLRTDDLVAAFQIHGINQALLERGEIQFRFTKEEEEFRTETKKLSEFLELPTIVAKWPLRDFVPSHYAVEVSLIMDGSVILSEKEEFMVTYTEGIARPWIYSKLMPGSGDSVHDFLIASQLFNQGRLQEAKTKLENALKKKPDAAAYAIDLARILFIMKDYSQVETVLLPFYQNVKEPAYPVYYHLGRSYIQTGRNAEAIALFEKAAEIYGMNIDVLNLIGLAHSRLGNFIEALAAWEKSLEINPNQPGIKENVKALKEKK